MRALRLIRHTQEEVTGYNASEERHTSIHHEFRVTEDGIEDPEAEPILVNDGYLYWKDKEFTILTEKMGYFINDTLVITNNTQSNPVFLIYSVYDPADSTVEY